MKLEAAEDRSEATSACAADPVGVGSCSLEDLAERIGRVIAWIVVALRRAVTERAREPRVELAAEVADAVVRDWIGGLDRDARAHFLRLALSDRCYAESPVIVRAILEGLAWPGARCRGTLDPGRCPCDAAPHAAEYGARGLVGAARVRDVRRRCAVGE